MAKRFTDTELWDKEWYMNLSLKEKLLVRFLFDKCDVAGIWTPNWSLASLYIGETVTYKDLEKFSRRLEFIGEKIFIPDFIEFQYGQLSEKCNPHLKVIATLKKYGLYEGYLKGSLRVKEQEEEQEEEADQEEGGAGETFNTMPRAGNVGELPEEKVNATIELVRITKKQVVTALQVTEMWGVFKIQNLTGKKYYADVGDVHSHFINWIKKQDFTNGSTNKNGSGNKQTAGAVSFLERAQAKLAARGNESG
jgi:hypothetical protein